MDTLPTQGHTVRVQDIEMYYETCGTGAPLLLLHGGGGIGANWGHIFTVPPAGYQLILPDLRGHGRTTNPSATFTIRQVAHDVVALLDHVQLERVHAIGMSLGAKTLLHMATMHPSRIDAMVLVSAAPYFPEQARAIMRQLTVEHRTDAEWHQMRQWHPQGDAQIRTLWRQMQAFAERYDDINFTPPYLSTITASTLIVHGDRDPLYPVALALDLYTAIPHAYLWVIPNGGHSPIFGDLAAPFVDTVLGFLRGEWEGAASH
jgi:pimeloyl-ACP methyl ester carboxylesterase